MLDFFHRDGPGDITGGKSKLSSAFPQAVRAGCPCRGAGSRWSRAKGSAQGSEGTVARGSACCVHAADPPVRKAAGSPCPTATHHHHGASLTTRLIITMSNYDGCQFRDHCLPKAFIYGGRAKVGLQSFK